MDNKGKEAENTRFEKDGGNDGPGGRVTLQGGSCQVTKLQNDKRAIASESTENSLSTVVLPSLDHVLIIGEWKPC
jgi:hypothetical protein